MHSHSRLRKLEKLGQSVWIDWLTRDLLLSGGLRKLIEHHGVSGVTTNPSILDSAIESDPTYEADVAAYATAGHSPEQILLQLVHTDVVLASEQLLPVWVESRGEDGYVSWEVDPSLAMDARATVKAVADLHRTAEVPNLLVKIPGTEAGVRAFEEATAAGYSVNVTLLFSVERYEAVANAYLRGLERARACGVNLASITSVASFFVSRLDGALDSQLEQDGSTKALALRGGLGVANAKLAYQRFLAAFNGPRWNVLRAAGARPQRLLWASTSAKRARYRDVHYVEQLIGPSTITTVPESTLEAFLEHGEAETATLTSDAWLAEAYLEALEDIGVDVTAIADELERDGLARFASSAEASITRVRDLAAQYAAA